MAAGRTLRAEAEYNQLVDTVFIYGSVTLALAAAKETGMVDVLCQAQDHLSSSDIDSRAKLKERYVREVLNSLTVAGFVRLQEGTGGKDGREARYLVPQACRAAFSKAGALSFLISAVVKRYPDVLKCFQQDGPSCVRYGPTAFNPIDEVALMVKDDMTEAILQMPGLRQRFESGIEAAEVGCGTGRLVCQLASMFPNSHFTVTDVATEPLEIARQRAQKLQLTNITFELLDVCQVPADFKDRFDWLMSVDVIHDLPHPPKALQGIFQALKPGGHYCLVDKFVSTYVAENVVNFNDAAAWYAIGTFMCIPESCQEDDSDALGPAWGTEKATELLTAAGFKVLGLTRTESLGTTSILMCQKPE